MSEETNDGTWSGLKKTIVGTLSTVITGGGVWLGTTLYGGHEEASKEETKTEQPAAAPVIVNVQQNQENKQKTEYDGSHGGTVIYQNKLPKHEEVKPEKPVATEKPQEESW